MSGGEVFSPSPIMQNIKKKAFKNHFPTHLKTQSQHPQITSSQLSRVSRVFVHILVRESE